MGTRIIGTLLVALVTALSSAALAGPPTLRQIAAKLSDHVDCDGSRSSTLVEQQLTRDERGFLRRERKRIVPLLVKGKPSRAAAAILAFLGERHALPTLRRWFLAARWFYGWESNSPSVFAHAQYRDHACFERAILRLAQRKSLALRLTPAEIRALVDEYRRRPSQAPLYLLYRFATHEARTLVLAEMRRGARKRDLACLVLHHFLGRGANEATIRRELGQPDQRDAATWRYRCDDGAELRLVFRGGALRQLLLFNWHHSGQTLVRQLAHAPTRDERVLA
ncbi:MAG: hypothetical protein KC609_10045, partial [Myxococcales bacterium]|nr:hypothetical protein [Myxococcales bacterium]